MGTVLEALRKRRAFAVQGVDGVFIRLPTQGEKRRLKDLDGDVRHWWTIGKILCDELGASVYAQEEGETDAAFAARVQDEMTEVDDGMVLAIGDTFTRLHTKGIPQTPEQLDALTKN